MMRLSLTLILFVCVSLKVSAQYDQEPKPIFVIETTSEKYLITEGENFTIDASPRATVVSVKLAPHRKFVTNAFHFDYPSSFAFEYEGSPGYKNWTLDGNNFVIMLFELEGETELSEFVNEIVGQFGRENCSLEDTDKRLGKRTLYGTRVNVSLVGQSLTLDFLEIESNDGNSRFIAFQDSLTDNDIPTQEGKDAIYMISESIVYK